MQFLDRRLRLRLQPSAQALLYFRDSGFLRYLPTSGRLGSVAVSSLPGIRSVGGRRLEGSTGLGELASRHQINLAAEARRSPLAEFQGTTARSDGWG